MGRPRTESTNLKPISSKSVVFCQIRVDKTLIWVDFRRSKELLSAGQPKPKKCLVDSARGLDPFRMFSNSAPLHFWAQLGTLRERKMLKKTQKSFPNCFLSEAKRIISYRGTVLTEGPFLPVRDGPFLPMNRSYLWTVLTGKR